ncbi:hypothetical protein, partial [Salmonella enterica]|uniref:hypothetical protein n=1 Tax=Salmonella enterica TaxID=28901 RepID=UPI001EE8A90A
LTKMLANDLKWFFYLTKMLANDLKWFFYGFFMAKCLLVKVRREVFLWQNVYWSRSGGTVITVHITLPALIAD